MFRKIFLLFVINLFFFIPIVDAQVYEDKNNGYSIEIPQYWRVIQTNPTMSVISSNDNEAKIVIAFLPKYPLSRSQDESNLILNEISNRMSKKTPGAVDDTKLIEKIGNQEAISSIYSFTTKNNTNLKLMNVYFWVNDSICQIAVSTKPEKFEELKPIFLSVLNSFKLQSMTAYDWAFKGYEYQKNREYDKAIDAFSKAANLDVKNTEYIYQIAYTNSEKGDYNQAIAAMTKAIELNPKEAFFYHERAYAHIKARNAQLALEDENKAIQINPKKAILYAGRGNAYAIMGKYEEAITDFQKCFELKGNPLDSAFNLGQTYELMGRGAEALKYYKMVVEYPNLPNPVKEKVQARINGEWESYKEWI
ncbi:tetratricopeptide repeat protein [Sporomusa aerivorans]|uniref:tetratricopeptide repeat protein n=1 Tax=Sporomusa aerivorans TaxID=204936 RepID=UPI00352AEC6A